MFIGVVLTQSQFIGLGSLNRASILFLVGIFRRRSFFLDADLVEAGEETFFPLAIVLTSFLTRAARFLSSVGLLLGRDKRLRESLERRKTSIRNLTNPAGTLLATLPAIRALGSIFRELPAVIRLVPRQFTVVPLLFLAV